MDPWALPIQHRRSGLEQVQLIVALVGLQEPPKHTVFEGGAFRLDVTHQT